MEKWELTPGDLHDADSSVCWNTDCPEYSERVTGCCIQRLQDGECEDRYQMSDHARAIATAAGEKARRECLSERDALRAEVEVMRRDIAELRQAFWNIALNLELSENMNPDQMRFALQNIRAISEARKGEG